MCKGSEVTGEGQSVACVQPWVWGWSWGLRQEQGAEAR